jgi:type IV secretory pathway VirB6-like protein
MSRINTQFLFYDSYFKAICHKSVKYNYIYFLLKHDNMFRSANTIIRPLIPNFQNKAKYSVIIFTIWDPICLTIAVTM